MRHIERTQAVTQLEALCSARLDREERACLAYAELIRAARNIAAEFDAVGFTLPPCLARFLGRDKTDEPEATCAPVAVSHGTHA